ncbi:S8 family serine peptidase [Streptomyces glaucescens]|uniref:S8 family serine peptidase n=1 Tax=Streptomyces glaucescens TaxID=1907 RepID=UPI001FE48355|nr:S8 family serine peptidase [Streptomyces glaucescens]
MRAVGAIVGALAAVGVGPAPNAAAADAESQQWYLEPMQTEQMWEVSTGEGVKVAVIDSGVNANTPSLKGQVLVDEVPKSVSYRATVDYSGHGTSMAELIAGTGEGGGIQGLAPGAKIVPYRVETIDQSMEDREKTPQTHQALRAAADSDAKIISMSIGGMGSDEDKAAIKYAASKGKLLVAAVGNDGFPDAPAIFPYVIGVGAVDSSYNVTEFAKKSSHGFADLVAPGEGIPAWCDGKFRSYCTAEGTSHATALVSASAALIWSAHPDWTVNQVTRALLDTASRGWPKDKPSKYAGYGMIRPRVVLADPNYDPGPPDVDPLAKINGGDVLAKAGARDASNTDNADNAGNSSSEPSASASGASQAPGKGSTGGTSAAGSNAETAAADGDSGNTLWIPLGAAAAVIVISGAGAAVLRARRAR